jgi:hypothetical protein
MDLSSIYSKSWDLIKKYKILWLFGFFAGCGQASGSSGRTSYSQNSAGSNTDFMNLFPPEVQRWFLDIEQNIENNPFEFLSIFAGFFVVAIIFSLLLTALRIYGKIGIISGVVLSEKGAETIGFDQINPAAKKYFWRIVFLYVLVSLAGFAVGIAIFLSIFTIVLLIPMICFGVIFLMILNLLLNQIFIAIVLEDLNPLEAFKRSWSVVTSNIPLYLTVGIVNFFGLMIIAFVLSIPVITIFGAFIFLDTFAFYGMMGSLLVIGLLYAVIYSPIMAFKESTWVLTYMQAANLNFGEADGAGTDLEEVVT